MVYIVLEKNQMVTEYYLRIIESSIRKINLDVQIVNIIDRKKWDKKNDYIVVSSIIKAFYLKIYRFKNVITWFQGLVPEESYLKKPNYIKFKILGLIESFAIKRSIFLLFVSNEMKKYYESKYEITLNRNEYYIMPCYNTELNRDSFFNDPNKYSENIFVYAGGLSIWQNFEKTVQIYKNIEQMHISPTKFWVLTSEKAEAEKVLLNNKVQNFQIDFLSPKDLNIFLAGVKFGFIVRDQNIINQVSTPTKISTYIGNGVIPIYSSNLIDFEMNSKRLEYKIDVESNDYIDLIKKYMLEKIDPNKVFSDYSNFFDDYYNTKKHISNLSLQFYNVIKKLK